VSVLAVYEEEFNGFVFREEGDLGRPRFLVVGVPDVGLVGEIAATHIIRSLGLEYKVGIDSYTALPPVLVIERGNILPPIRVYAKGELAVLISELPIAPPVLAPFSSAVVEYARARGVEYIISATGIGNPLRVQEEKPSVYWLASDREAALLAGSLREAKIPQQGILVGVYAMILKEAMRKRVHNLVILVDSYLDLPDPEAAARAVEAISQVTGVSVNVEELLRQAEEIKLRTKELMKETRSALARLGKGIEYRAPVLYT
jgi:uncharacterized protein